MPQERGQDQHDPNEEELVDQQSPLENDQSLSELEETEVDLRKK